MAADDRSSWQKRNPDKEHDKEFQSMRSLKKTGKAVPTSPTAHPSHTTWQNNEDDCHELSFIGQDPKEVF